MDAESFNLDMLIRSMKELRDVELGPQVRSALEGAELGLDSSTLSELVDELEHDLEEHISRLERISDVLNDEERARPELMPDERKQAVAFQSGCDFEEVDSLCEAFSRARDILGKLATGGREGARLDIKLLFSNLAGLSGADFGSSEEGESSAEDVIRRLFRGREPEKAEETQSLEEFEALFELEDTARPKNRLPKDWNP